MPAPDDFRTAVRVLHREKDRAYGRAWKRRGELVSIIANIARKVDRLEQLADGGTHTRDESAIDTAVDLLVYGLKYQTYLADLDCDVARLLFPDDIEPPFSDSTEAFDALLARCDLSVLDHPVAVAPAVPAATVVTVFAGIEGCLAGGCGPARRQQHARDLCLAAVGLIAALCHHDSAAFAMFVKTWQNET